MWGFITAIEQFLKHMASEFAFYESAVIFPPVSYSKGVTILVYENFLAKLLLRGRTSISWNLLNTVLIIRVKQN